MECRGVKSNVVKNKLLPQIPLIPHRSFKSHKQKHHLCIKQYTTIEIINIIDQAKQMSVYEYVFTFTHTCYLENEMQTLDDAWECDIP